MRRAVMGLVVAGILTLGAAVQADELGIGDDAPKLDVTKWVKGKPVDLSEAKGKGITVVEFWATWCGPCVASVPHLTHLQEKYGDKGVTVLGMTKFDDGNTLDMVKKFVKKQGDKLDYTIAFEEESKTYDAFMKAAGQNGIPTAFIVDKSGRVAWIGHPQSGLEDALGEMVAGKFDIEVAKKVAGIKDKMNETWADDDFETRFKLAGEWSAAKPKDPSPHMVRSGILHRDMEKPAEALEAAKVAFELAHDKPQKLSRLASQLTSEDNEKGFNELAMKAISRALELEPKDAEATIGKFRVLVAMGKESDAVKTANQAIKDLDGDAPALARFARVLSTPARGEQCTDLAIKAVELAIAAEPDEAYHLMSKFKILATCKKDIKAARGVGTYLIEKAGDDAGLLNAFAWDALTGEGLKGEFNDLALEAAKRCDEVSEGENWMYVDTFALATFESGARDEAIKLQRKAIKLAADNPAMDELLDRLLEFAGTTEKKPKD